MAFWRSGSGSQFCFMLKLLPDHVTSIIKFKPTYLLILLQKKIWHKQHKLELGDKWWKIAVICLAIVSFSSTLKCHIDLNQWPNVMQAWQGLMSITSLLSLLQSFITQFQVLLMTDSLPCPRKSNDTRNDTPPLPLSKWEGLPHCHNNQLIAGNQM